MRWFEVGGMRKVCGGEMRRTRGVSKDEGEEEVNLVSAGG